MKGKRKKHKPARTRDWTDKHELAFTHDRARHRKAEAMAPTLPPAPTLRPDEVRPNAIVVSHSGRWAFVEQDGREVLCILDESLGDAKASVLAPGDRVQIETIEGTPQPIVRGVAPRATKLSRLAPVHSSLSEQVIAANIDVLVIVAAAARPAFRPGLVDRYMIAAEVGGVRPILVVNKMDLVESEPETVNSYRELGMAVIPASCETGMGVEELREALRGSLNVVAGHSGVGKSSLLNAMDPSLDIVTQEVSASTEKGRHTTTASRLYTLEGGVRIVDTPGARNLGLWGVSPQELAYYFPDLAALGTACRFRDCTHTHEPHCAVREGVESGELARPRYASYLRIRESLRTP